MILLAIDTCFNRCAAGLYDAAAGRMLAVDQLEMERGHAEALAPLVQRLLAQAGLKVDALSRVAVTTGPGTFTGLRIGLSFARALGLARTIPVIGLDTLRATALAAPSSPWLVAHMAGQSGFFYVLRDAPDARPEIIQSEVLRAQLQSWNGLVLGTGAAEVVTFAQISRNAAHDLPDIERLAQYASSMPVPDGMPEPVYLREADAKPQVPQTSPLRAVTEMDLPALATIHHQCFPVGWSEQDLKAMLAVSGTQGALIETAGQVSGFIIFRSILGESEIITLAVLPSQRGQGLGKNLLQAAIAAVRDQAVTRFFLEVNETNAPALALYRSSGFAEAGRRKDYYETPAGRQDAILMAKSLP
jgi:tRNA threonylcarbamoyl adenosine modification protein YeaZ/ribosomal-protein-alanine acetyltransferase